MKQGHRIKIIYGFAIGVVCVGMTYWLAQAWMVTQHNLLTQTVSEKITEQELRVSTLSAQVATVAVDDAVSWLFHDCLERQRFDELLNKLSGTITNAELTELSLIYDRCAPFYSNQRAVMALALQREVQMLDTYITINNTLTKSIDEKQNNRVNVWNSIVKSEIEIARLFMSQVDIQRKIIESLKMGKKNGSTEITAILSEAQETANQIAFQQGLIEKYRQQLN